MGEIESGEWYGDDTMRLISIITMTFGKYVTMNFCIVHQLREKTMYLRNST